MTSEERKELSFSDIEYIDRCSTLVLAGLHAQGVHDCGFDGLAHDALNQAEIMLEERKRRYLKASRENRS